jgi:hypothetical protein
MIPKPFTIFASGGFQFQLSNSWKGKLYTWDYFNSIHAHL